MNPRFTAADLDRASEAWGCNCGPSSVAAICSLTLDEVRPHFDRAGFPGKYYTNPTMMFCVLGLIGKPWKELRRASATEQMWPRWGLCRIQWEGPWTQPGVPIKARYRQTHWIGAARANTTMRAIGVWDCNAMGNGTGWCALEDWTRVLVPHILESVPRSSGGWHITHAIEVAR